MAKRIETMLITTENGPVRINRSDYDPEQHTAAEGEDVTAAAAQEAGQDGGNAEGAPDLTKPQNTDPRDVRDAPAVPNAAPAVGAAGLIVTKKGKKHIVVDAAGKPVTRDGIDAAGYETDQAAWDAVLALPK